MVDLAPVAESPQLTAALQLVEVWGVRIALAHWRADGWCSCRKGPDECGSPAKHPYGGKGWRERATSDPELLRALLLEHPHANIGIATGRTSGIVVLDIDGEEGERSLSQRPPLPAAPEVRTAHGRHVYFRAPADFELKSTAGKSKTGKGLADGLDLRAEGGFIVCPPSINVEGVVYCWVDGRGPAELELPEVPAWIVEQNKREQEAPPPPSTQTTLPEWRVGPERGASWADGGLRRELELVRNAPKGTRNAVLNTAAFNLGAKGALLDAGEVKRALVAAAMANGLSEFEATKTVRSGYAAGLKKDGHAMPTRDLPRSSGSSYEPAGPSDDSDAKPANEGASPSPFEPRYSTSQIFAPLPAQRWAVPGLQIGPGRPTLFVGFGGSAKTLAAQSLALSLAAGRPVWERFESAPASILHLDYEQGFYASAKRYQRLAIGHGIDPRELESRIVYVELPRVYLDSKHGAAEAYLRACDGFDVVVIDSLRGAAPFSDENDSSFRAGIDLLTFVSQRTGASMLALHHAGKPRVDKGGGPADMRTLARGSGAIFDAAGCVFNFVTSDGVRLVRQAKTPAEVEGTGLDLFELAIEDIDGTNGVRVSWRKPTPVDESARDAAKFERDAARVIGAVTQRMGGTANQVIARVGLARGRALDVLRALTDDGRLELVSGPRKAKIYRIPAGFGVKS